MLTTTASFPGSAFRTGRGRTGEPLLYNEEIKASLDELISTIQPGDTVEITKLYMDQTMAQASLFVLNDKSVSKSGDLPMFYTTCQFSALEGWRLAADLGLYRTKTRMVTITLYQHKNRKEYTK